MQNTYLTSYFPLMSICLFSLSLAKYTEGIIVLWLEQVGMFAQLGDWFSEHQFLLMLLFILTLIYFMIFSALKLIANTINELTMLFFSKDRDGTGLSTVRSGAWIFLIGSLASIFVMFSFPLLMATLLLSSFIYFVFFVYKVSDSLSSAGLVGMIFFQLFFWFLFITSVFYALFTLYEGFLASLPLPPS
ncbi:DUF5366 family protein [Texcoconibacillus texcoconensis]|uniref:YufK family protein n=1 Tax=Texcoconibacillus texcoconensis TaxID=1095777 RepID=A0A840QPK4_9BACI|nr:DUF5366 family protein [Texcoconibacillus texcoconensis]MBB5173342.1 hypothetical protein [Texcoconibacillus texcoconensis]